MNRSPYELNTPEMGISSTQQFSMVKEDLT